MSSKSRARLRAAPEAAERDEAAEEQASRWAQMNDAYERANTRRGLSDLVGLVLKDREEAMAPPKAPEPPKDDSAQRAGHEGAALREPTQYERAMLSGLSHMPHVYAGTVEPERVAARRRRNKVARASRKGRRRKQPGKVLHSRFGWPIHIPGISQ